MSVRIIEMDEPEVDGEVLRQATSCMAKIVDETDIRQNAPALLSRKRKLKLDDQGVVEKAVQSR
jgi:hypothetical protein